MRDAVKDRRLARDRRARCRSADLRYADVVDRTLRSKSLAGEPQIDDLIHDAVLAVLGPNFYGIRQSASRRNQFHPEVLDNIDPLVAEVITACCQASIAIDSAAIGPRGRSSTNPDLMAQFRIGRTGSTYSNRECRPQVVPNRAP